MLVEEIALPEFKSWNSYTFFANHVRSRTRFARDPDTVNFLDEVLRTSEGRIRNFETGFRFWRAQIGSELREQYDDEGNTVGVYPAPFLPKRMKPIPGKAKEGRANPKGIPVLYLATSPKTAMCEIRPWVGARVSCAMFKTTRALKLVDLSVYHDASLTIFFDKEPDSSEKEKSVWTRIDQAFSTPVSPEDDEADYAPTQVIAEFFKSNGFDGLGYKSALSKEGYNVALFNLGDAILDSCTLYGVNSIDYDFTDSFHPYKANDDGSTTMATFTSFVPAKEDG